MPTPGTCGSGVCRPRMPPGTPRGRPLPWLTGPRGHVSPQERDREVARRVLSTGLRGGMAAPAGGVASWTGSWGTWASPSGVSRDPCPPTPACRATSYQVKKAFGRSATPVQEELGQRTVAPTPAGRRGPQARERPRAGLWGPVSRAEAHLASDHEGRSATGRVLRGLSFRSSSSTWRRSRTLYSLT